VTEAARLESIVDAFRGGACWSSPTRGRRVRLRPSGADSREAPVLILRHDATDVRLGGGANAVHNIRTLGGTPCPSASSEGRAAAAGCRALLREKGIAARGVFAEAGYPTPVKSRVLAGRAHSTKQQIVRIDRYAPLAPRSAAPPRGRARPSGPSGARWTAVLVSDYGCGLLDAALVRRQWPSRGGAGSR